MVVVIDPDGIAIVRLRAPDLFEALVGIAPHVAQIFVTTAILLRLIMMKEPRSVLAVMKAPIICFIVDEMGADQSLGRNVLRVPATQLFRLRYRLLGLPSCVGFAGVLLIQEIELV